MMYRVEDAAIGIWTQEMVNLDRVNLVALAYSYDCWNGDEIIYVNPIESTEMTVLMDNVAHGDMCRGAFLLNQCRLEPCLCHPPPEECSFLPTVKTWAEFSNAK